MNIHEHNQICKRIRKAMMTSESYSSEVGDTYYLTYNYLSGTIIVRVFEDYYEDSEGIHQAYQSYSFQGIDNVFNTTDFDEMFEEVLLTFFDMFHAEN